MDVIRDKNATELDDLNAEITKNFSELSKRLQQVAKYILDSPNEIAFGTVAVIAKDANVHPSTLIRFSHAFGFTGFSDMQKLFQNKLLQESPNYEERIKLIQDDRSLEGKDAGIRLLEQLSHANSQALTNLKNNISQQDLEQARNILSQADSIHVKAVRRSFPIASYLAYLFNHINLRCFLLDGVGGMHQEQDHLIRKNDAVIVISFYPYADETQQTLNNAIARGNPVIVFTDSLLSPLAQYASVCFVVKEAEVHSFRSLTSTMCLVQSLALSLVHQLDSQEP
ncbi:MAG: MurR/RpiR family transcriptional regulator [Gammaproteobacteria bacterium]|nr:MurR/RpiR family transcriptional regulator [Gammaproteobacteria bacterium]